MRKMIKYRDYLIEELSAPEEAIAYLETSLEEYQKDGDTVAFLLALQSIAEAQAGNNELVSQVYLLSGGVHFSRKEYDWAIEDYNTVIKLNSNNVEAYIHRGLAYHHKGEVDRAIVDFNKAVALSPNYADAYYNRGVAYRVKGEYDRAIADYNKAIELKPNDADAYSNHWTASLPWEYAKKPD